MARRLGRHVLVGVLGSSILLGASLAAEEAPGQVTEERLAWASSAGGSGSKAEAIWIKRLSTADSEEPGDELFLSTPRGNRARLEVSYDPHRATWSYTFFDRESAWSARYEIEIGGTCGYLEASDTERLIELEDQGKLFYRFRFETPDGIQLGFEARSREELPHGDPVPHFLSLLEDEGAWVRDTIELPESAVEEIRFLQVFVASEK